ncbi:MAG: 23S rRNA (adenine(2503)-C(2))-methyltransferase RlmN, partial [Candidatus Marinimicrobia bacterium]|nr:23S rRNA (adenine(2503)-C(2))-methyltransferase RlmN [Candidatus Neomarinimicrobiota bacterium]
PLRLLDILEHESGGDGGTDKFLFQCLDGKAVESVLIRSQKRVTLCVSSQVGCAMNCAFCRTADMGFIRDLSAGEILEQYVQVQRLSEEKISNVVFMGMGEPFNNFEQSVRAALVLNHEKGPQIAARHITFSTSGIVPKIREFAHLPYQFKLAISLNAATNRIRDLLMPVNRRYPLEELLDAAKYYVQTTNRHLTFEYVLIKDVNNGDKDAAELMRLLRPIPCKLNVIPFNETGASYRRPDEKDISRFLGALSAAVFPVTLRLSGGRGINAACGQLYHEVLRK